jgi:hypothetical protein
MASKKELMKRIEELESRLLQLEKADKAAH